MAYSENWHLVEVFTVVQAAYLWEDLDPPENRIGEVAAGGRPPAVAAIIQFIQGAIEAGQLTVTWHDAFAEVSKNYFEVSVTRTSLFKIAWANNEIRSFLFDTLGSDEVEEAAIKNTGGRPARYNWNGCIAEVVRIADIDGLPSVQNELVRKLQAWFMDTRGDEPAESEIRRHISPIYKQLKSSGWKPRDG